MSAVEPQDYVRAVLALVAEQLDVSPDAAEAALSPHDRETLLLGERTGVPAGRVATRQVREFARRGVAATNLFQAARTLSDSRAGDPFNSEEQER